MSKPKRRRGRDGWCHYCDKRSRALTWDHVVPKALGGPTVRWNFVTACEECNHDKDDRPYPEHCDECVAIWARFNDLQEMSA